MTVLKGDVPARAGILNALEHPLEGLKLAQRSNFWEATARLYEPLWRYRSLELISAGRVSVSEELERLVTWTNPQAGMHVLDAACSGALYARTLLEQQPHLTVHAVDYSPAFLREAQRRAWHWQQGQWRSGTWQQPLTLVHADVRSLPYADDAFDMVVCGGSLNEFIDLPTCLTEMARVLKPQGAMWQMYVQPADVPSDKLAQNMLKLTGINAVSPGWLEQHVGAQGLVLEQRETYGTIVFDLYRKRPADTATATPRAPRRGWWFGRKRR